VINLKPRILRLRTQLFEPGQLVKVTADNGDTHGGIVLDVNDVTNEVLVQSYYRAVGSWTTYWWPVTSVQPMITGMTAAESREIALTLLERGRLPANAQAATTAYTMPAA
jgi:hypothetical protein